MANLPKNEILRFDFRDKTYAVYHTPEDLYYATDGICTHGNTHLADGYILGEQIECPKHNGRFSMKDGSARRHPACVGLGTYPVMVRDRMIYLNIHFAGGTDALKFERPLKFKVTENKNVTTFIRELVLEQVNGSAFPFTPGDYLQIEIPPYEGNLRRIQLDEPYNSRWQEENVFECFARNPIKTRRNYSIASNPETESRLKFNVRLSLPPAGVNCSAGIGSTYIFNLKPGDILNAYGPFGDFHIRDSRREMVYVGGGAGMAPIVSHISYLFDTLKTERKVSYWYGARSKSELYYHDYFESLAENHGNFEFHVALSQPSAEDHWTSFTGNIDQVLRSEFFPGCEHPEEPEFYLCGPPVMIRACLKVLKDFKVNEEQVSFDEF
jgi:Na(+)-translocating NADH:ubiquinone oxidoreductase F subunit